MRRWVCKHKEPIRKTAQLGVKEIATLNPHFINWCGPFSWVSWGKKKKHIMGQKSLSLDLWKGNVSYCVPKMEKKSRFLWHWTVEGPIRLKNMLCLADRSGNNLESIGETNVGFLYFQRVNDCHDKVWNPQYQLSDLSYVYCGGEDSYVKTRSKFPLVANTLTVRLWGTWQNAGIPSRKPSVGVGVVCRQHNCHDIWRRFKCGPRNTTCFSN